MYTIKYKTNYRLIYGDYKDNYGLVAFINPLRRHCEKLENNFKALGVWP